jgi:hypothetical protein
MWSSCLSIYDYMALDLLIYNYTRPVSSSYRTSASSSSHFSINMFYMIGFCFVSVFIYSSQSDIVKWSPLIGVWGLFLTQVVRKNYYFVEIISCIIGKEVTKHRNFLTFLAFTFPSSPSFQSPPPSLFFCLFIFPLYLCLLFSLPSLASSTPSAKSFLILSHFSGDLSLTVMLSVSLHVI